MDILLATTMRLHLRSQKIHLVTAIHYPNSGQPKDNNTFLPENTASNFRCYRHLGPHQRGVKCMLFYEVTSK